MGSPRSGDLDPDEDWAASPRRTHPRQGRAASPQVDRATAATASAVSALERRHGLFDTGRTARLLGTNPAMVQRLQARGELLAMDHRGQLVFPGYQFTGGGEVYPSVPQLIATAEQFEWSLSSLALWLDAPNGYLTGDRPCQHLADPERVVAAARSSFDMSW